MLRATKIERVRIKQFFTVLYFRKTFWIIALPSDFLPSEVVDKLKSRHFEKSKAQANL